MWVKKHNPRTFDDIVGNRQLVSRFRTMTKSRYMQHMILCGPSGVGKSTMVNLLLHNILGESHVADGTLIFQSADERGNQTVRDKIRQFVPKKIQIDAPKFVVFKQADMLSDGVQQIMRRLMEQNYHRAVFIFICSDISGILQTIQSRCHIYQFRAVSVAEQVNRLRAIAAIENICTPEDSNVPYERLAQISNGDMRACVNYFQASCCALLPTVTGKDEPPNIQPTDQPAVRLLTLETIQNVCLFPHYDQIACVIRKMLVDASDEMDDVMDTSTAFYQCIDVVHQLHHQGYCGLDIVMFFNSYLVTSHDEIPRNICVKWLKDIAICHNRLSKGIDSTVQLYSMVASMFRHAMYAQRTPNHKQHKQNITQQVI